jgi:catechol 2,3-dioxygenase-like lactoylglutathione lyase family enzyme
MGLFDSVSMGAIILRVRDVDAAVDWYRASFDIEPLGVGVDGQHRIATYVLGGFVVSLWQLPAGCRDRPNVDVCPYPVFVTDDLDGAHGALVSKGLNTTGIRESTLTRFFQTEDLDGNRWEFSERYWDSS